MSEIADRLDCFAILAELERLGVSNAEVARLRDRRPSTIQGWKQGSEPRYSDGIWLLALLQATRAKIRKNESDCA